MILANTRQHLSREDAQLAVRLLARDTGDDLAALERKLADEGIDAILDDPRLPAALLRQTQGANQTITFWLLAGPHNLCFSRQSMHKFFQSCTIIY